MGRREAVRLHAAHTLSRDRLGKLENPISDEEQKGKTKKTKEVELQTLVFFLQRTISGAGQKETRRLASLTVLLLLKEMFYCLSFIACSVFIDC